MKRQTDEGFSKISLQTSQITATIALAWPFHSLLEDVEFSVHEKWNGNPSNTIYSIIRTSRNNDDGHYIVFVFQTINNAQTSFFEFDLV